MQLDNEVIVIGADHHNTLAVIRCLGKLKCRQKILIHTDRQDTDNVHVAKSRYAVGKVSCVAESAEAILQWLQNHATDEKRLLIPCTDLAAYVIDINYAMLSEHYVLPGFKNAPGKVVHLMDKWEQSKFAAEHGLPMAKTWSLKNNSGFVLPEDMLYPCIVKPEVSAFGSKGDIAICTTPQELGDTLARLASASYDALVVQQFLNKEYEVCAYGCLVEDRRFCAGGTIRKVREFPPKGGGSLTFAQFIDVEEVNRLRDKVLDILYRLGYRGQYDIELLVCQEGVYLNEINFRHSGNGYGLVQNGVFAPYLWCADAVGADISATMKTQVRTGKYHMDELSDLMHLKDNHVFVLAWVGDCLRTSAFSKWDIADLKGAFAYYAPLLKAAFRKVFRRR